MLPDDDDDYRLYPPSSPAPVLSPPPRLAHTLHHHQKSSVLALAAHRSLIFAACQTSDIHVWSRTTFQIKTTLQGHTGSVLALQIASDRDWLLSSSGDSTVRIWSTRTLSPLYVLTPHLDTSAGDIFSLCYSDALHTLYFGCQNTSLQWYDFTKLKLKSTRASSSSSGAQNLKACLVRAASTPPAFEPSPQQEEKTDEDEEEEDDTDSDLGLQQKKWHPFFNSVTRFGPRAQPPPPTPPSRTLSCTSLSLPATGTSTPTHHPKLLQISPQNIIHSAHFGYIYCMAVLEGTSAGAHSRKSSTGGRRTEDEDPVLLITGSGDETVKVWACSPLPCPSSSSSSRLKLLKTFTCTNQSGTGGGGAVLSLIARDGTVYAGCQDGYVAVWDLETGVLVRRILAQENSDILTISMISTDLYTCCANGWIQRWNAQFLCTAAWKAHDGIVLSSIATCGGAAAATAEAEEDERAGRERRSLGGLRVLLGPEEEEEGEEEEGKEMDKGWYLVSGGNDNDIKIWSISHSQSTTHAHTHAHANGASSYTPAAAVPASTITSSSSNRNSSIAAADLHDPLLQALSTFVAFPSVSNSATTHREDCRRAAMWLRRYLAEIGGQARMIGTSEGFNPLVLATFKGVTGTSPTTTDQTQTQTQSRPHRRPCVLFYGHYDVIAAPRKGWNTDPFELTGTNGYLYARGISDNKGPILAVAHAVSDLLRKRLLGVDVVFLVEGEEEAGSKGFEEAVRRWRMEERGVDGEEKVERMGEVDAVLISNSYWIGEDTPCITYGLRGVVHATLEIGSGRADLHSGVEGGGAREPMGDLVRILAGLADGSNILIPGFYDKVCSQSPAEQELYTLLSNLTHTPAEKFTSRWREPSLTIHSVEQSGPGNPTVIPATVRAKVSLRIVPDQDLAEIAQSLVEHVKANFDKLGSPNRLSVRIDRTADWWLGDLESQYFKALEDAITKEWGVVPLKIREGGSIPSIPFLEKEFGCPALHLPMGQSSDQAHLPNERISLTNLRKGKAVVEKFLMTVARFPS